MSYPMFEFMIRAFVFMAIFLVTAYFLFVHIEKVKLKYGTPEDKENYLAILKHYFFKH